METIRVNMTPCEDIKTIHASQNDNEAREWGFELHNNGEKIDSSSISDQLVFKAYKGGTEQILPTNGSTPTTSPFLGDIKYPQGLLSDQEFLYRESPTEEDGLAKITDIKGNTLVWNQLVQNGNFADGLTNWTQANATLSVSNGVCRATLTGSAWNNDIRQTMAIVNGHKYLLSFDYLTSTDLRELTFTTFGNITAIDFRFSSSTTKKHHSAIYTATADYTGTVRFTMRSDGSSMSGQYYEVSNVNLFDLTQMGLDISNPSGFTSLFSLPYYAYNQGTLLSFNGNGIKTTNADETEESTLSLPTQQYFPDGMDGINDVHDEQTSSSYVKKFATMTFNGSESWAKETFQGWDNTYYTNIGTHYIHTDWNTDKIYCVCDRFQGVSYNQTKGANMVVVTGRGQYIEFFAPDTITSVADWRTWLSNNPTTIKFELAIPLENYGIVDLGSLTYTYDGECFIGQLPSDAKVLSANTETLNSVCNKYLIDNWSHAKYVKSNMVLGTGVDRYVCVFNSSYTDPSAFKQAMQGVYLLYEKENPQGFTTASLVTENTEMPLSNDDGVLVVKCTEQLSSESGFFDAKIKLADDDGECYSNKIQLHVERKPS